MTSEIVDNLIVDLTFLEMVMEHDGGEVVFSVKELLVEQREELRRIGEKIDQRPTKDDLDGLKRDISSLRSRVEAGEIRWAKLIGGAIAFGVMGGGLGAAAAKALGVG